MKISRLKLLGFKSFVDQSDFVLEPGLTGIVGPNGCGKSNLVEALRWVMGESSYKNMRASSMDDVIFSGSGGRPARNSAEVTLVLDNSDRTAPAALNDTDILEVTRRIEREAGSVYKVNGKDVRARDVQLLFADASTGARSPALVRQGQIGELISAKPTARRALLEEAAGISGLHSRRHEAELRLRAADANLERIDDIIAEVGGQLDSLKRQARQATRYRNLSGEVRKAEATLYHIRWVTARAAARDTEASQAVLIKALAEAQNIQSLSVKDAAVANEALPKMREVEAEAGAGLQRILVERNLLDEEEKRLGARKGELEARLVQIVADIARETDLITDNGGLMEALTAERSELQSAGDNVAERQTAARVAVESADAALREIEVEHSAASAQIAQVRARKSQLDQMAASAAARVQQVNDKIDNVKGEQEAISRGLAENKSVQEKQEALDSARNRVEQAEAATVTGEASVKTASAALEAAQPVLTTLTQQISNLKTEADTLSRVLNLEDGALWPAIIDALDVTPGYETALGAAFGDDLDVSSDKGAPLYWAEPGAFSQDGPLPAGAQPLTDFVQAPALLTRRLRQIGVVEKSAGMAMMNQLAAGQMLVTLDGDVWRWDGFVAAADAPSAAAQRLAQRNRLADIEGERKRYAGELDTLQAQVDGLREEHDVARLGESEARNSWRSAQHDVSGALAGLQKAERDQTQLTNRRSALEEAALQLTEALIEAENGVRTTQTELAALDNPAMLEDAAAKLGQTLADCRAVSAQSRATLSGFETEEKMRAGRLSAIEREQQSWTSRIGNAKAQIDTLEQRRAGITSELDALNDAPNTLASRRRAILTTLAQAEQGRQSAADNLAVGEALYRETEQKSRASLEQLSTVREQLGRIEERLQGALKTVGTIEQQIEEVLECRASQTSEIAGLKPEQQLPQESQIEARVDRLKRERERLGGVNLRAEQEATETAEKLDIMVTDREDLVAAIAKLRTGISSLNKEGRARLLEAFDTVNGHFKELFSKLFGGGTAELTLIESDDPLEAGLEIIARPPGKKPQTLTLLSGGEQALTAMSLIFAVFLTNPAPLCVLDEVDAPLDDANVERFCNLLDWMNTETDTRFVVITHNPITMARVDRLFGVTMAERGISQIVSVDLQTAESFREAS